VLFFGAFCYFSVYFPTSQVATCYCLTTQR